MRVLESHYETDLAAGPISDEAPEVAVPISPAFPQPLAFDSLVAGDTPPIRDLRSIIRLGSQNTSLSLLTD
jgi:hypothetical protein